MSKKNTSSSSSSSKKTHKDKETKRKIERWILDEVKGQAAPLACGAVAMTVSSYANQLVPQFLGRLMDPVSRKNNNENNSSISLTYQIILLSVVGGGASFFRTVSLNFVQDRLAGKFRMQAFEGLLTKRDLEWFHLASSSASKTGAENEETNEDENPGTSETSGGEENDDTDITSSMTPAEISLILKDDVDCVAGTITGSVANLLRGLSSCLFGTYNMLCLNPNLFALSVLVAPVVGTVAYISRKYTKHMLAIQHQAASRAAAFVDERVNHIMMVKMSSREEDEIHTYNSIQDQFISSGNQSSLANGISMGSMFALSTASLCGILLAGGRSVQSGKMKSGDLVSFSSYSFLLALGSASIVKSLTEISKAREPAARLYSLIFGSSGYDDNKGNTHDNSSTIIQQPSLDTTSVQSIATENISFAYKVNQSNLVLRNVSLKVSVGELVVIIGENGAGKSTIASLLAGLYTPISGDIVVHRGGPGEKTNYKDLDSKMLSKLVQVVPQEPALFDTSILENVQYSCPDAPIEKVRQALTAANCDDFISKLDGGLEYQVGRNGKRLSGGQRQRIGLARALLADPVLLALDEPASSLDAEGESAVSSAISACRASRKAMLLITHNPKALLSADRVVIMDNGTIQQEGTLFELKAQKSSLLAKLMPGLH